MKGLVIQLGERKFKLTDNGPNIDVCKGCQLDCISFSAKDYIKNPKGTPRFGDFKEEHLRQYIAQTSDYKLRCDTSDRELYNCAWKETDEPLTYRKRHQRRKLKL